MAMVRHCLDVVAGVGKLQVSAFIQGREDQAGKRLPRQIRPAVLARSRVKAWPARCRGLFRRQHHGVEVLDTDVLNCMNVRPRRSSLVSRCGSCINARGLTAAGGPTSWRLRHRSNTRSRRVKLLPLPLGTTLHFALGIARRSGCPALADDGSSGRTGRLSRGRRRHGFC